MTVRHYSSAAGKMVLQLGVTAVATAMQVDTTTGLPGNTPFSLLVDVGLPTEEIVTVTQVSGNTLVVVRGEDGTSAQPHANGAVVRHAITARDLRDSRDHENANAGVHGVTGNVVGTTNTQTLSNKTLSNGVSVSTSAGQYGFLIKGAAGQTNDLLRFVASDDALIARVLADGTMVNTANGTIGAVLSSATALPSGSYWHYLGSGAVDKTVLNLNAPTGATAKILSARVNGVEVAGISATGSINGAGYSGGPVAGTTGTFSGAVTGSNLPATSAAKAGKRIHWGYTSVTTTGAGATATVTHGAGFTPQAVIVQAVDVSWRILVDSFTATTFRVRTFDGSGNSFPLSGVTIAYFCGE